MINRLTCNNRVYLFSASDWLLLPGLHWTPWLLARDYFVFSCRQLCVHSVIVLLHCRSFRFKCFSCFFQWSVFVKDMVILLVIHYGSWSVRRFLMLRLVSHLMFVVFQAKLMWLVATVFCFWLCNLGQSNQLGYRNLIAFSMNFKLLNLDYMSIISLIASVKFCM